MDSEEAEINDIRAPNQFKGMSFSEFKKADVKKELIKSLYGSKVEPACYWAAELICAGAYADLWDTLLFFYGKHIHLGNPKCAIYLEKRVEAFRDIVARGYVGNELAMRNSQKIRALFAETICVLSSSKKKHSLDEVKVKKGQGKGQSKGQSKGLGEGQELAPLKAPHTKWGELVFKKSEDPVELFVATNELMYRLSPEGKSTLDACYWIEWIVEKSSGTKGFSVARREFVPLDSKLQTHPIWLIWEAIIVSASTGHCTLAQKVVKSLLTLYCLKFSEGSFKRRKFLVYFAVSLLTEKVSWETELMDAKEKERVPTILANLHAVYRQVKENEKSPNTDYLFTNLKKSNLEKTIEKLDKMSQFSETFVPRTDGD